MHNKNSTTVWRSGGAVATARIEAGLVTMRYVGPATAQCWRRAACAVDATYAGRAVALLLDLRSLVLLMDLDKLATDAQPIGCALTRPSLPSVAIVPEEHFAAYERFYWRLADFGIRRVPFIDASAAAAAARRLADRQRQRLPHLAYDQQLAAAQRRSALIQTGSGLSAHALSHAGQE